jgi:hypothetical protein
MKRVMIASILVLGSLFSIAQETKSSRPIRKYYRTHSPMLGTSGKHHAGGTAGMNVGPVPGKSLDRDLQRLENQSSKQTAAVSAPRKATRVNHAVPRPQPQSSNRNQPINFQYQKPRGKLTQNKAAARSRTGMSLGQGMGRNY